MIVTKPFTDKITKVRYEQGEEFEGSKERVKELQDKGFLEEKPKKEKK